MAIKSWNVFIFNIFNSSLAIFPNPFALRSVRSTRLEGLDLE